MNPVLNVDDLELGIRWSERRKTLQLTVDRGGELLVFAPTGTELGVLESFVRDNKSWVYTKLAKKELLRSEAPPREMVTGEGFHYLGRTYRLELVRQQDRPLKLSRGRFRLLRAEKGHGKRHFVDWYSDHGRRWIADRVERLAPRMRVEPVGIEIRDLGNRWGSCGRRGVLNFHWATILLPPPVVEYVAVHELAHLHELHHTAEFWRRVERVLPDFEGRKEWLARNGSTYLTL